MLRRVSPRRSPRWTSRCRRPGAGARARCRVRRRHTPAAGASTRTRKLCLVCALCCAWRPIRALPTIARGACAVQVRRGNGPQTPLHTRGLRRKRTRDARGGDLRRPRDIPWLPPQTVHGMRKGRSGSQRLKVCATLTESTRQTDVCQHHPSALQRGVMRQVWSVDEREVVHTPARAQAGGLRRP